MMKNVSIVKAKSYNYEEVYCALKKIIENTDFPECRGKKVLIKTNIVSDAVPEKQITTNPICDEALVRILQEMGADAIYLGDSPAIANVGFKPKNCGIQEVCNRTGAIFPDFAAENRQHVLWHGIKAPMAKIIDEVDVVISFAKFKTHQLMYSTGAVKNMFGLIPGLNKSPMHLKARNPESFSKFILSVFKESHTNYGFIDGIVGMEGPGPSNGTPRQVGLLMGSSNLFALDAAEAIIMGYQAEDIPILKEAMSTYGKEIIEASYPDEDPFRLVIQDYRRIPVKKSSLFRDLVLPFFLGPLDRRKARERKAPCFQKEICRTCGRCVQICPAKALTIKDKQVVINEKVCIRCYCCHEVCPYDAIVISEK